MGKAFGLLFIALGLWLAAYALPDREERSRHEAAVKIVPGIKPAEELPTAVPVPRQVASGRQRPDTGARPGREPPESTVRQIATAQPMLAETAIGQDVAKPARLSSTAPTRPASADARRRLVSDLQRELARAGCYRGAITGEWDEPARAAMRQLTRNVNATLPVEEPDYVLLALAEKQADRACGITCGPGEMLSPSGRCAKPDMTASTGAGAGGAGGWSVLPRGGEPRVDASRTSAPAAATAAAPDRPPSVMGKLRALAAEASGARGEPADAAEARPSATPLPVPVPVASVPSVIATAKRDAAKPSGKPQALASLRTDGPAQARPAAPAKREAAVKPPARIEPQGRAEERDDERRTPPARANGNGNGSGETKRGAKGNGPSEVKKAAVPLAAPRAKREEAPVRVAQRPSPPPAYYVTRPSGQAAYRSDGGGGARLNPAVMWTGTMRNGI